MKTLLGHFCLYLLTLLSLCTKASQDKFNPSLADSIRYELSKPDIDTASFGSLLLDIRSNRRVLKEHYKPLLLLYVEQSEIQGFKKGQMLALDRIGLQERYDENYEKAIDYHMQSLQLALELNDSMQLTYNYNNIAQAYRKRDLNALAIRYFHKALRIQEKIGDIRGAYFTQNTLGATYLTQDDYDKALYYLSRSLEQAMKHNDKRTISYNYGSLGEVCLSKNQLDSALYYFELGKALKIELKFDKGIAVSDHLIGQALFAKNDLSNAEKSFISALNRHVKYKNERYQSLCLAYLGKIQIAKGELDSAEVYLTQAKGIAERKHSITNLVLIEDALFHLYKQKDMHGRAYEALRRYYSSRDSIREVKALRNIQSLDVEYQTRQREQEIALLSMDNYIKNQRIRLGVVLLVMFFLTTALGITLYFQRRKNSKMIEASLQHKLSQSQMNPHFVSNAMGSIQNFLFSNNTKSAAEYLGKFALLNRTVLEHSMVDRIALDDEISMLKSYLEFEQLRLSNAFSFIIDIDENIGKEMIDIPPLFIQPFVENAVKHGVKDMEGDGIIKLIFKDNGDFLRVDIIDNGKSSPENRSKAKSHKSRSTEIVQKRLLLLKNKYKKMPNFMINKNYTGIENGYHVIIHLPIL